MTNHSKLKIIITDLKQLESRVAIITVKKERMMDERDSEIELAAQAELACSSHPSSGFKPEFGTTLPQQAAI